MDGWMSDGSTETRTDGWMNEELDGLISDKLGM